MKSTIVLAVVRKRLTPVGNQNLVGRTSLTELLRLRNFLHCL